MDGKFVPWHDANVHVLTHTLHYGLGVFEGIAVTKLKIRNLLFFDYRNTLIDYLTRLSYWALKYLSLKKKSILLFYKWSKKTT